MAIITISRGSLSGGGHLAQSLGARLGYRVISREVIVEAAKRYGVAEEALREEMKSPPGLWDRLTHHKEQYLLAVQAALAELVAEGNAIYHGHAGHLLLKSVPGVLKLRLIAPLEYRVKSAIIEHSFTRDQAIKHIALVDEQRHKWVKHFYNVEWTDPSLYDMVINLEHISIESATELVVDLIGRKEYRDSAETSRDLKDFALQVRLRAELTFHSDFPAAEVEVKVRRGVVQLGGGALFEKNRRAIVAFIKGIPGVGEVTPDEDGVAPQQEPAPSHRTARDLMIQLERYPHIHRWNSIREALVALSASTVQLDDGHLIYPRYILVFDEMERPAGILNRRDLLRGLSPQLQSLERAREQLAGVAPYADMLYPLDFKWASFFDHAAVTNSHEPVASVLTPLRGTVKADDDLSTVVMTMIQHGVDLVPVTEGDRVVGVVLMTDVFDIVAQVVLEGAAHHA